MTDLTARQLFEQVAQEKGFDTKLSLTTGKYHDIRTEAAWVVHKDLVKTIREPVKNAKQAVENVKELPVWDSINHKLHGELDVIFANIKTIGEAVLVIEGTPGGLAQEGDQFRVLDDSDLPYGQIEKGMIGEVTEVRADFGSILVGFKIGTPTADWDGVVDVQFYADDIGTVIEPVE